MNNASPFRGYIATENKQATEKFANRKKLKTYEDVKNLSEFAGVLAQDAVLIDIDDFNESEVLFKVVKSLELPCTVVETTRGKHFYFINDGLKSNKTKCRTAIGIMADMKLGARNSYAVLKFKGKERRVLYKHGLGAVPRWLFPVASSAEFLSMDEGDGRNQALFNYILTLQSHDFSKREIIETLRVINNFMLSKPLSDKEFELVTRDEAFNKVSFFDKHKFLHAKMALYMAENDKIIKIEDRLHIYQGGVYVPDVKTIARRTLSYEPKLTRAQRTEVIEHLDTVLLPVSRDTNVNLIAFANGVYDLTEKRLKEFSPDVIITNKINWDYNPEAYSKYADDALNRMACGNREVRALLEEAIGYCFYRGTEPGKAFVLTGDKSNGKSTFLAMLHSVLGAENVTSIDLKDLGDRFKTAELYGKLANIGDDIGEDFISDASIFKKLVTGERVTVEKKSQDPFSFGNYAKLLFSANIIPRIRDRTGAVMRRLVIIPFNANFSPEAEGFDPQAKKRLTSPEVMEYAVKIGVDALTRLLARGEFIEPEVVVRAKEEFEERNNPLIGFVREAREEAYEFEGKLTSEVYEKYHEYCISNNLVTLSKIEFSRQLCRMSDIEAVPKKVRGELYRVYVQRTVPDG